MKRLLCILLCALTALAVLPGLAENHNWYEVFVRSYQDSDGDGIGDLNGLADRLDYIRDMGYDGLWLMPIMPSPSYHKYDVTDYCAIDPEYGTLEDMRALIEKAHGAGIKLIIDLPINHSSTRHPWFLAACEALRGGEESPYIAYYNFQQKAETGFAPLEGTDWYYEERFAGGGMPDLNLDNEQVWQEIEGILHFWLADMDVDGFRLDAVTSYYTGDHERNIKALTRFKALCEAIRPDTYLVGECWTGLTTIADYYRSGLRFFLFPASQAEGFVAASLRGRSGHAEKFAKNYQAVLEAIPEGVLAPFLSNHDTGRTIGSVQGRSNLPIAKFAEGVLNMMQGDIYTYYGEEIGMVGSGDDPNKRLAMYWSDGDMTAQPPGVTSLEYAYPSVEIQQADPDSLLQYCRRANQLRLKYPMIAEGENEFLRAEGDLCVMRRASEDGECVIVLNFSAKDTLQYTMEQSMRIGDSLEVGAETAVIADGQLILPPYSIVILIKN